MKIQRRVFRRCSRCALNWPLDDTYHRCPRCLTPTAVMNNPASTVMTAAEAQSLVSHLLFEEFYSTETAPEREARLLRSEQLNEYVSVHGTEQFEAVIEGAQFDEEERRRIAVLEELLPKAHQLKEN